MKKSAIREHICSEVNHNIGFKATKVLTNTKHHDNGMNIEAIDDI